MVVFIHEARNEVRDSWLIELEAAGSGEKARN
jgi:hypothetical protein